MLIFKLKIITPLILLFSLWQLPLLILSQGANQNLFYSLTNKDGLSQGTITCMIQDEMGFVWIGTYDGLNRYDGYNFKVFRNYPDDTTTISNNQIKAICQALDGNIWIGTAEGLNKYDQLQNKFSRFKFSKNNNKTIVHTKIEAIVQDDNKNLWLGTKNNGLIRFNPYSNDYEFIDIFSNDSLKNSNIEIKTLFIDSENNLWIGCKYAGLYCYNLKTKKNKRYINVPTDSSSISFSNVWSIVEDKNGNLWIGSIEDHLVFFDKEKESFRVCSPTLREAFSYFPSVVSLQFTSSDSLWIGSNNSGLYLYEISKSKYSRFYAGFEEGRLNYDNIRTLLQDKKGNLWIGTHGKGINIYSRNKKQFHNYQNKVDALNGLSFSSSRAIYEDDNGVLWVSGYNGFDKINTNTNEIVNLKANSVVYCICPDPNNNEILWIGNEGQGVSMFNTKTQKFTHFNQRLPFCNQKLDRLAIYSIINDANDNFLLGTEDGIIFINPKTKESKYFTHNPEIKTSIVKGRIKTLYIDSENTLWLGSRNHGLSKLDIENNKAVNYINTTSNNSLSNNSINCFFEDSKKRFWIGTLQGLNLMNRKTEEFYGIYEFDGLPNSTIYSIQEDNKGNLWLSTNKGLCKFNPDKKEFDNYDKTDGLIGNEFNKSAFFKNAKGTMYFGGVNGITYFNPEEIDENSQIPTVVITDFFVNHKDVDLDTVISYKKNLIIKPNEDIISFEFSTIGVINSVNCRFAYRLVNLLEDWTEIGSNRSVSFTNLNPGTYKLQIKACNEDGIWNSNPTTLIVKVLPKYYETLTFKIIVVALVILIPFLIILSRGRFLKAQRKKLEHLVKNKTNELENSNQTLSNEIKERINVENQLRESNITKDKFMSIIAHDLISPFNTLIGFSDILIESWDSYSNKECQDIIKQINNTSNKTYNLLTNLLEWAMLQKKEVVFKPNNIDLNEMINETINQLEGQASLKSISLISNTEGIFYAFADYHMINTILRNLISNSIKFTQADGWIKIAVINKNDFLLCSISDSGVGMSEEKLKSIFITENSAKSSGTKGETGTGLGLILCREFVKRNNGKIWAESTINQGTTFYFTLPSA